MDNPEIQDTKQKKKEHHRKIKIINNTDPTKKKQK